MTRKSPSNTQAPSTGIAPAQTNEVSIQDGAMSPVAVQDGAMSPLAIVARAAADPNVDADKLAKLYDIQERYERRQAEIAYQRDMNIVQQRVRKAIKNRRNDQTSSDYANLEAVLAALRPVQTEMGFSLSFGTVPPIVEGTIRMECEIMHREGHSKIKHFDCPVDGVGIKGNPNKTPTHAAASSVSYAQRILNVIAFNLSTGYDDDGNGAGGAKPDPEREKAERWIERAKNIETPGQYQTELAELVKAYGADTGTEAEREAARKKIPHSVKQAFQEAYNDVMPRDGE